jgi:hypothetical protein
VKQFAQSDVLATGKPTFRALGAVAIKSVLSTRHGARRPLHLYAVIGEAAPNCDECPVQCASRTERGIHRTARRRIRQASHRCVE